MADQHSMLVCICGNLGVEPKGVWLVAVTKQVGALGPPLFSSRAVWFALRDPPLCGSLSPQRQVPVPPFYPA